MQRRTLLSFALCSGLTYAATPLRGNTIQISTLLENDPASDIAEQVLKQAYLRLGLQLQVKKLPGERSLYGANNGETDGELYRKIGMERDYPNLVIIPVQ